MANELQYYADPTTDSGLTIDAKVYDSTGTQVGADVVCTEVGVLAIYQGTMPVTGAGIYSVRFYSAGTTFEAQGKIEWDGTTEITNSSLETDIFAKIELERGVINTTTGIEVDVASAKIDAVAAQLTAHDTNIFDKIEIERGVINFTTGSEVDVASAKVDAVAAQITALNDLSAAQVQTELVTYDAVTNVDLAGLATSAEITALNNLSAAQVEAALLNELDGQTFLASIQASAAAALTAYDPPTRAELASDILSVNTNVDAEGVTVVAAIDALTDITPAQVQAELVTYDAVIPADIAGLATSAEIAALNNLSAAQVQTELVTYDAVIPADIAGLATSAEIAALPTALEIEATLLNELDGQTFLASIQTATAAALTAYDAVIPADLASLASSAEIAALNNLSAAQVQTELVTYDAVIPSDLSTLATAASIAALNNLSAADVQAQLVVYDAATGSEVTGLDLQGIVDLLEADQIKVGSAMNYYLKGSAQTTLLLSQTVTGDSALDANVSIIGA